MSFKNIILVPTYNEAENIIPLLTDLTKYSPESDILVIDDNSPDGTANLVKDFQKTHPKVFLLERVKKDGLGQAYIAGFRWGLERNYETFVQMDADFSHSPSDVPRLTAELATYDMAIGSRYIAGGGTSGWTLPRKIISRCGNIYAQTILGHPVHDLTGGFTASHRKVVEGIKLDSIKSKGYAFQVEIKYRTFKGGFKIKEVPIHFANRIYGISKMSKEIIREAAVGVFQMRNTKFV